MRILITGGAGFIGCHATNRFAAAHRVTVLDNLSRPGARANLEWLHHQRDFAFLHEDVRDAAALHRAIARARPDVVLHLASQVAVTASVSDPRHDFEVNALGTFNLLEAVRHQAPQALIIYASTNKVYGKMDDVRVVRDEDQYRYADLPHGVAEDRPLDCHSPYGCSKGTGDQYVRDYARIYGLRTVVFRQSCIYGTRQFGVEDQGWLAWFAICAVLGRTINIYGDGLQVRDVLWVDELLDAYQAAIDRADRMTGCVYNIGGGPDNCLSLCRSLSLLERLAGRPIPRLYHPQRPGDQCIFLADTRLARRELNWLPRLRPEQGIEQLFHWVSEHKELFEHEHSRARLALLADYHEEGWASMDLCADQLADHLRGEAAYLKAELIRPPYRRRLGWIPLLGRSRLAVNGDRFLNRMWDYPRAARALRARHDLFHLCDHSYAQLIHQLPAERTGAFCHDLDTFRCLLRPREEPRPRWFRAVARRILSGLQRAAVVFHTTRHLGQQLEQLGLLAPGRLVQAPPGLAPDFRPEGPGPAPEVAARLPAPGTPWLLHVGSCIPRKRVDVLLAVFAAARARQPDLRLVKVGGDWTPEQQAQMARLGIGSAVIHLGWLSHQRQLAPLYRLASLVLVPSEQEGFGLPVVEALACGAVVVASDLPTLREAGGAAALYRPCGDVAAWADCVGAVLEDPGFAPPRPARLLQVQPFSWEAHARTVAQAYLRLRNR